MTTSDSKNRSQNSVSRRRFLAATGAATAGLLTTRMHKLQAASLDYVTQVAVTQAMDYSDPALIKQKVQHLFESIGGISDVVSASDKVAVKINLTGGSGYDGNAKLQGYALTEAMWTHPTVLRAVCELLIDHGVSASNITIVEALYDMAGFNNFGYKDVKDDLGLQLVNLNEAAPYADFMEKSTGDDHFNYSSFTLNRILDEVDVYVSIPKMKHHYEAGVTHSMKNQVGMTPLSYYGSGYRASLHGGANIKQYLPRTIVDLALARPVNLAVIDGIINANGGEGVWNDTFEPAEYHLLLAGKDPVATDSICSLQMGNNPEADQFQLPRNGSAQYCDNYLKLASELGMGTNTLSEIELVGDGAELINTAVPPNQRVEIPKEMRLAANFPNPFNPTTHIKFSLPNSEHVTLKILNSRGQEIETLVNGVLPAGSHEQIWTARNMTSGIYLCQLRIGSKSETMKMTLQK
ncbi:DUF362 domain-containing protein [candidate division KSB1 bacterium]|nr:DUF362 domain-containing protein [candidate division KSB1 bacterium]